ncbi:MAG: hypothetical protein HYX53_07745 [Chloroflexi bacterium]|nr:hypothetical protein [Chloroflexota bacterium]
MSFRFITADNQGEIYAVDPGGNMIFYQDLARDGTPRWANGGIGQVIGQGWADFANVFCGGDGRFYAIAPGGDLFFFRDLARDGTENWANGGVGARIGDGWDAFTTVFSGGDGVIYAVNGAGELLFFRDLARDGTDDWANGGAGQVIGDGWNDFRSIVSGGDGVIYAVTIDGDLLFFKDLARDGTANWANGGVGAKIGDGWGNFAVVVAGGDGILYAVTPDGFLLFYQDLARDGTEDWAFNGVAVTLGGGWLPGPATAAAAEGYCWPLSAAAGDTIQFMVSAESPYNVTYLRLHPGDDGIGMPFGGPNPHPGGVQGVPVEPWRDGCGWNTSFALTVAADWVSGFYAAQLSGGGGDDGYIVFVVKPPDGVRGDIAVLANTITWNAYNDWGGRSKYTAPPGPVLSYLRPNPALTPVDRGQIDHLARADLWILSWLEDEGYAVDCWADTDFHKGIAGLDGYKALVLSTHPEYWTSEMMDRLEAYLAGGGSVLYLGGNGLFEQVVFDEAGASLTLLNGDETLLRDINYFRNLDPPRPERAILGVGYRYDNFLTFAPYEIRAGAHRFFAGTGLSNGDLVGATGLNGGGASGWEMDTAMEGTAPPGKVVSANGADDRGSPPPGTVVLARGTNPGFGADMTAYDTAAGGVVFSVGSIAFGGSLVGDDNLKAILRNVLNECIAR